MYPVENTLWASSIVAENKQGRRRCFDGHSGDQIRRGRVRGGMGCFCAASPFEYLRSNGCAAGFHYATRGFGCFALRVLSPLNGLCQADQALLALEGSWKVLQLCTFGLFLPCHVLNTAHARTQETKESLGDHTTWERAKRLARFVATQLR